MDRKGIKSLAKEKIKGNIWNLLWPLLVFSIISSILTNLVAGNSFEMGIDLAKMENLNSFADWATFMDSIKISPAAEAWNYVVSLVMGIAGAAYLKYLLNFIRKGSATFNDIIDTIKAKWLQILLADILVGIIVFLYALLLIVPGIIMSIAYAMVNYLIIDSDIEAKDALKKSNDMMRGYKWDYFVFNLSFIGWYLLVPFTLGLLLIWLIPYVNVADALYYEKLKEING